MVKKLGWGKLFSPPWKRKLWHACV